MNSNPLVINLSDTPQLIQESPVQLDQDPELAAELETKELHISQMANNPQIQVMSPTPQPFGYEAILTQEALVGRLANQPYVSSSQYEERPDLRFSDAVASAQPNAEDEIFRNSTRSAGDIPVPGSNSNTSGQATPTVMTQTIFREVVHNEVLSAAVSGQDPNPAGIHAELDQERSSCFSATIVPEDRRVRRRTSLPPSTSRNHSDAVASAGHRSSVSPTRAALREQVAQQGETVDHLQGQLENFKDRTAMELANQRHAFIAAAQQHEVAAREVKNVAVAQATAELSAAHMRQSQAMQHEMLRLQNEAAQAKALAAHQASELERMSRERTEKHDAASSSAFQKERVVQTQSEDTLLKPSTVPSSFVPSNNSNHVSGHVQVSDAPTYMNPPQSVPYQNPPMSMSVSPQEFQSPLEDRSSLQQTLIQPTLPSRSDAVASAARQSDAVASAPVNTPSRRWKGLRTSYSAAQQCSEGDQCVIPHARPITRRQLSFERTPPLPSDAVASARIPEAAAPILSSPTPIQQEMDRLKAQLEARDQELHHAQTQLQDFMSKEQAAKGPSDSTHHFIGDEDEDDEEEEESEWEDDYFQEATEGEPPEPDQKPPAQAAPAQKPANSDAVASAVPSSTENVPNKSADKKGVSNAGGGTVSSSYLDNLLTREPRANKPLFPMRSKQGVSLPSDVSTGISNLKPHLIEAGLIKVRKSTTYRTDAVASASETHETAPVRQTTERPTTPRRNAKSTVPTPIDCSIQGPKGTSSGGDAVASAHDETRKPPMGAPHVDLSNLAKTVETQLLGHLPKGKEADTVNFDPLPGIKYFRPWRIKFFETVAAASGRGAAGVQWISEIERVNDIDDLEDDHEWIMFSQKLSAGLMKLISGDFLRKISSLKEKLMNNGRLLNGRQLAFLIWERYKRDEMEVGITEFYDLREVRLKNDNLKEFMQDWYDCLYGMHKEQDPEYLLSLFEEQVSQCSHFKQVYSTYKTDCTHHGLDHNYANLETWVQAHIEARSQEARRRQLQKKDHGKANAGFQRNGKGSSDAVASARKNDCFQWLRMGKCSRGDKCQFDHDKAKAPNKGGSKGKGKRPKSAPTWRPKGDGKGRDKGKSKGKSYERSRPASAKGREKGGGKSKGKSPPAGVRGNIQGTRYVPNRTRAQSRGKSPSGETDRPQCKAHFEGHCSKGSQCREWHISDCRFYKSGECRAGDRCIFYHRDKDGKIKNAGYGNVAEKLEAKPQPPKKKKKKAKAKAKAGVALIVAHGDADASAQATVAVQPSPLEQ